VAKAARARVEADFLRREASLRRTEDAGQDFIREQHMRQAIRAAEQTLRSAPPGLSTSFSPSFSPRDTSSSGLSPTAPSSPGLSSTGLSSTAPSSPGFSDGVSGTSTLGAGLTGPDAGADLADHTGSVLAAYRELTAGLSSD
jgi:hypothetical protein